MKAGFIQFEPIFGEIDRNLERVESLIEKADADLLVLPELFNTGYLFTSKQEAIDLSEEVPGGKTTQMLCRMAREKNLYLVGGLAEKSGEKFFNSAVLVSPEGYVGTYRKVHLFFEETLWFDPGDKGFEVYDIGKCRLGIMICFDWIFPEAMRVLSLKGADIICHSSNLVLPFCQDAMITRCLENHVFAITANRTGTEKRGGESLHYTGKSQITGLGADLLYRAGGDTEEVGVVDIDVEMARDKKLNDYNNLFRDRRPEFYGDIR
ncbi:MAG: acyltransferase [Proteobacteria bacterium]|nr:acyltransferase [Pseudomonadota bacterium]